MINLFEYLNYLDQKGQFKQADTQSSIFLKRLAMTRAEAYSLLDAHQGMTPDEIKSAYRRKALQLHPDVNKEPDAEERFKLVNNAYEMLKDAPSYSSYQPPTDEEPIYVKMQRWEKMLDKDMPRIKQKFYDTIGKSDLVKELWQSNDLDEYSRIRSNRRLRNKNPNFTTEKIQALLDAVDKFFDKDFYAKYPTASYYPQNFITHLIYVRHKNKKYSDAAVKTWVNECFDYD